MTETIMINLPGNSSFNCLSIHFFSALSSEELDLIKIARYAGFQI